jgi:predicted ribosomally synthesized peptide with nif11-like leader
MSSQAVIDFLNRVVADAALQQELQAAVEGKAATGEAIAAVARRHGHDFDVAELTQVVEAINAGGSRELSDEELEAVAGGFTATKQDIVKLSGQLSNIKYGSSLLDPSSFGAFKF